MGEITTALRQADDAARFSTTLDAPLVNVAQFAPYIAADKQAAGTPPPLPEKPTGSMVEFFKSYRPTGALTSAALDGIIADGDRHLAPTAKYLRNHFDSVALLGDERAQREITDNDLDILATLLEVDTKFKEANIAAHEIKVRFNDIDMNHDGVLILDEVNAYAKKHRPEFDSVHGAARAQWGVLAHADMDDSSVSWTDAANVANGEAILASMEETYTKHQIHAKAWWVSYAAAAAGAGAGWYLSKDMEKGARIGLAAVGAVGATLVGDEVTGLVVAPSVKNYYDSSALKSVNKLFLQK